MAAALAMLAAVGVSAGQLLWTANALLRDETRFTHVLHGALVREPLRSEAAPDLAEDLADIAVANVETMEVVEVTATLRRELRAVADRVVAGPAFDAQIEPFSTAMGRWAVTGREAMDAPATLVLWDAYIGEVAQTHPQVAQRLASLPKPEDVRDPAADSPTAQLDERARTRLGPQSDEVGLRQALRWLPAAVLLCYLVAVAAAVGAVVAGRGTGRIIALLVALPAAATLVAWAVSTGPGSWAFAAHAAAQAALPACAVSAAVAVAAVIMGSRRSAELATWHEPRGTDEQAF